jgi:hypothetical protein
MDILEKLNRMLADTTCHAAGSVDISQGPYGSNIMGMRYRKKKKKVKGGAEYSMHEDGLTEIIGKFIRKPKKMSTAELYKLSPEKQAERKKRQAAYRKKMMQKQYEGTYNKDFGVMMGGIGGKVHAAKKKPGGNPKMTMIDDIRDFIMNQNTWFEFDDAGDDYILLTTRENGDVGNETPGKADWREGQRLGKAIKQNFKNVKLSLDYTDEWVNLEVYV